MAGRGRKGRSCRFESLENRNLLAGDVTASIHKGDLILKGDNLANGIQITAGTTAGSVKITGISVGGSATNINGSSNGSVTLTGFSGDIKIKLKGGDDTVSIIDLDVPGKLKIEAGKGNDSVTLDGVTIDGKFKAKLSDGNDTLSVIDTQVTGKTKIKGKDGEDEVTIEDSTFTKLRVSLGDDDDTLDISGSEATGKTRFKGGRGFDTLSNADDNEFANFKEKNFEDVDSETPSGNSPTLTLSGASSVNEGSIYTLNLASSNSTSAITQWTINWGDGTAVQTVTGNPLSVTHTFADGAGTRTISATATNSSGTFNAGNTVAVTVNNVPPTLTLSGASSVDEGAVYTLNLSSSDPGADTISQWTINWGDGTAVQTVTGDPSSVTHTFAGGPGTRTISATATDEDGTFNAGNTLTVTVGNVAPTLSISGASSVNEGAVYTLNLSSSDPGAGTITQWTINWGDGTAVQTVTGNPSSVTHTFTDGSATHTIGATATNSSGTFNAGNTVTVLVNNVAPTLTLSGESSVNEGAVYTLNLSSSDPGADTITQWTINWGDGSAVQTVTGNPASVTHTFVDGPNTYTIMATATDEDGTYNVGNTVTVLVNNVAPTLTISGASSVEEGAVYTLNLLSSDPGADTITQWTINWGDGSAVQTVTGNPASVTHTFADGLNTYTISATVTDEDGSYNAGNTVTVTVNDVAPTLAIGGASSVNAGAVYTLNLSSSDPGADTITQWTINWGDGTAVQTVTGNPSSVTHTFAGGPNTYIISATATDEDGTYNAGNTVTVVVDGVAPTASISGPTVVTEGVASSWTLALTGDTDADTILQYIIHWGDGETTTVSAAQLLADGGQVTHTYVAGPNDYGISVDLVGEEDTYLAVATLAVSVDNATPVLFLDTPLGITENQLATLTGSYSDTGLTDTHLLQISWDDPNSTNISSFAIPALRDSAGNVTLQVGDEITSTTDSATLTITAISSAGLVSFSVQHLYLDDGVAPGNNLSTDTPLIEVLLEDEFGDSDFQSVFITVANVAPEVTLDAVSDISEMQSVTLTGSFTDIGLLDAHTIAVQWGDGGSSSFSIPAIQNNLGTATLHVGDVFNSTLDGVQLTITSIDAATGQVGFSVQHLYEDDGDVPGNETDSDLYTISVTVTDDDGESATSHRFVTVHNVAPQLSAPDSATADEEGTVTLLLSLSDPGTRDILSVSVDWQDGVSFVIEGLGETDIPLQQVPDVPSSSYSWDAATKQLTLVHTYAIDNPETDTYTATFTASDDDLGVSETLQTTITVNVPPPIG